MRLLVFFLIFFWSVSLRAEILHLAVQPCWNPEKTLVMFKPLADYLSGALGVKIKLLVYDNAEQFHHDLLWVDLALQDAYSAYIHLKSSHFEPLVVAVDKEGQPLERGAIIVRADSPYHRLEDLKGTRFIFGALHNTAKFFSVWIYLRRHGLNPQRDFKEIALGGECLYNAMTVVIGDYDAGAVCADFFEEPENREIAKRLRVIAYTDPAPGWMFTVSARLDQKLRKKLLKVLLKLNPHEEEAAKILKGTPWSGFIKASGQEIREIKHLVNEYQVPEIL